MVGTGGLYASPVEVGGRYALADVSLAVGGLYGSVPLLGVLCAGGLYASPADAFGGL